MPHQVLQLEEVWGHDISGRYDVVTEEFWDARPGVEPPPDITHDWVGEENRLRVSRLHQSRGLQHDLPHIGRTEVASEHSIYSEESSSLVYSCDHIRHVRGGNHGTTPAPVPSVVGEGDGIDGVHIHTGPLQRKGGGRVSRVTVGDGRLDR